jgi:hypothetical protein
MTLRPALYRFLTTGLSYDIPHYIRLAREHGGPVLELGAGLGRTLLPLAAEGIDCEGLECDREMLSELRALVHEQPEAAQKHIRLHFGEMHRFLMDRSFGVIQIPLRTFQLLGKEDRLRCLSSCADHLLEEGRLAIHISHYPKEDADGRWRLVQETGTTDGGLMTIEECLLAGEDLIHLRHRMQQYNGDGLCVGTYRLAHDIHCLTEQEAIDELSGASFEVEESIELGGRDLLLITKRS